MGTSSLRHQFPRQVDRFACQSYQWVRVDIIQPLQCRLRRLPNMDRDAVQCSGVYGRLQRRLGQRKFVVRGCLREPQYVAGDQGGGRRGHDPTATVADRALRFCGLIGWRQPTDHDEHVERAADVSQPGHRLLQPDRRPRQRGHRKDSEPAARRGRTHQYERPLRDQREHGLGHRFRSNQPLRGCGRGAFERRQRQLFPRLPSRLQQHQRHEQHLPGQPGRPEQHQCQRQYLRGNLRRLHQC